MQLSILISYYNRIEQLKRGINSLLLQKFDPKEVELVFLNDGADKEAFKVLQQYRHRAKIKYFEIIKNPSIVSHSASRRNFLVRQTSSDNLLFCEPEMVHFSNTIPQAINAFKKYGENIWYCGKVYATKEVVSRNRKLVVFEKQKFKNFPKLIGKEPTFDQRIDLKPYRDNKIFTEIDPKNHPPFFWCTAISKKYLMKVQGFHENLVKWGYEETELFSRMKRNGVQRIYDPAFITYHQPHQITLTIEERCIWDIYNKNNPFKNTNDWGKLKGVKVQELSAYQ